MNTKQDIQDFVAQDTIAVAGVSRDPQAFSRMVYRELKAKGYRLIPVNPGADAIEGDPCHPNLASLPAKADGVLIFTKPQETEKVAREAVAAGIGRIWIQQGAESEAAIRWCMDNAPSAVWKRCIMMFAEPVESFHGAHRWFARLFGRLPR